MKKRASNITFPKLFFVSKQFCVAVLLCSILMFLGCRDDSEKTENTKNDIKTENKRKLHILVSNSLTGFAEKLKKTFAKKFKFIEISTSTANESSFISKVHEDSTIDFVIACDYKTLQSQLKTKKLWDFVTIFATDEMVVCHSNKSAYADKITQDNWQFVLSKEEITFGHVNPKTDVCGLRTVLLWELADNYYRGKVKGRTIKENLLDPKGKKIVQTSPLQLLPLLRTGTVDYIFIYRSLAEQQNLPYTRLRPKYNLGHWHQKRAYAKSKHNDVKGAPISLAFAICNQSRNKNASRTFGNFLLSSEGSKITSNSALNPISKGATLFTTKPLTIPIDKKI